jgi:subtilisin family serine protease
MSETRAPVEVYDPALAEARRAGGGDDEIALIARVTDPDSLPPGVRIVSRLGDIMTLRATRAQLQLLADCPAAVDLEAVRRLIVPIPPAEFSEAADIAGAPEPSGYTRRPHGLVGTGSGVIVAALDWGFDFAHPAFRRPDGTSRFIALWDQRGGEGSGPGNRWGYGRILTRDEIDRALASADPYAALGYHPGDAATLDAATGEPLGPAHGTHVLDIAAGSVRDDGMCGVAPDADLVGVHLAHTIQVVGTGNLGESASVLEAFDFVCSTAGDRPTVVNMSVGAQGGPHDDSSLVEQGIDQAVQLFHQKVASISVGNYAHTGAHRHGRLRQGQQARLTIAVPTADRSPSEVEIWYSGTDRFSVTVFGPDGQPLGSAGPGGVVALGRGTDGVGRMYHVRSARNGRHLIDVLLAAGAPSGEWVIELTAESVPDGDGRYYSWIERESGPHPRFVPQDDDPRTTTGSLCNGRLSIAVGAYDPHTPGRPIAPFSSAGPTVDGLVKPEVVAPGLRIRAARSAPPGGAPGSATAIMSGTSMASPHVAGLIAVMLQAADETLDVFDIRAILLATADRASPAAHHAEVHRIGAGYLNPVAAERAVADADFNNETSDRQVEFAMITPSDQTPSAAGYDFGAELNGAPLPESEMASEVPPPTEYLTDEIAEESPLLLGPTAPPKLPLVLAGPIVRRAQPDAVWFWIACSQEITECTPVITVYNTDGSLNADLTKQMVLEPARPQVRRLGAQLWVALVAARPTNLTFGDDWIYGYDLLIGHEKATTSVRLTLPSIAYKPFDRPTFQLGSITENRIAHGSCRRPGGWGFDASVVFDKWVAREACSGLKGKRPSALFLTGDQIYADDVAYPLFLAVRRLAADIFGYDEFLPLPAGAGTISTAQLKVNDWRGLPDLQQWVASARARLTRRPPKPAGSTKFDIWDVSHAMDKVPLAGSPGEPSRSPAPPVVADRDVPGRIGFTTEDGQGHMLSFAEFAAMYLLVWSPDLWARYVQEEPGSTDAGTDNLTGFAEGARAARRLMANMPTYMLCDDHEITDDWNLDGDWAHATANPMSRRVISNGLAAYWAFQAWGNDPSQFDTAFVSAITGHLADLSTSNGKPGLTAAAFDDVMHAKYWAYAAPTRPPVLCVDTRTRREFLSNGKTVMSGKKIYPELRKLLSGGRFKRAEPVAVVLPTPFLGHRSMFFGQEHVYSWPRDRYEGDYELYGNNPDQRPDVILFFRDALNPPALVVLSGDVHHGSVIDGMYVGGPNLEDIYRGKATWAMRIVQITSSAIKNIKKDVFIDNYSKVAWMTDKGNAGESLVAQSENQFKSMPDGTCVAQHAAAAKFGGDLGRRTFIYENHYCVVDFRSDRVDVLFIGDKRDSKEAFESGRRKTMPITVRDATTSVSLANDPKSFTPSLNWLRAQYQMARPHGVGMRF